MTRAFRLTRLWMGAPGDNAGCGAVDPRFFASSRFFSLVSFRNFRFLKGWNMSSQREIADFLGLSERRVRGLQALGVFPKKCSLDVARDRYSRWKTGRAAASAAARAARDESFALGLCGDKDWLGTLKEEESVFESSFRG